MGLGFLDGNISSEQIVITPGMRGPELSSLPNGKFSYIEDEKVWIDRDGKLWVDSLASLYSNFSGDPDEFFIKVIKLPEGYVIDISEAQDRFIDPETGDYTFTPQVGPWSAAEGEAYEPTPVVAIIETEDDVKKFNEVINNLYGYEYPFSESVPDN